METEAHATSATKQVDERMFWHGHLLPGPVSAPQLFDT
jgi:hypothetical protein